MELLNVDYIFNKFLTDENNEKYSNSNKLLSSESNNVMLIQKKLELMKYCYLFIFSGEKTILQPEDSKKPLSLSKEEIGRHSW
jgi:hypothetical protein